MSDPLGGVTSAGLTRWRPAATRSILLGIALLTCWLTYTTGRELGMATLVSTRHAFYSLPYAISSQYFGTDGYVILRDVAAVFMKALPKVSNDTMAQAMALTPARGSLMYFPGDDKGDADFAILAIQLFGPRVESLYYAWFALFGAAIVLFAAGHWREGPLLALCATTLSIYIAFFALPLTSELGSIQNPRVFGMVSLVSVLHLSLAMIDRRPFTFWQAAAGAAQALLIALSIHVRTPEAWQAIAVFGVGAWLMVRWRWDERSFLWPAAVLAVALVGLNVYQRASMDEIYKTTHLQRRTMWHNVVIGFALNPALARQYDLMVDDMPVITLVRKHLAATNRGEEIDRIFQPAGREDYAFNGIAKDFAQYERVAREVTLEIIWSNKLEAAKTFFFYKPRVLWRNLAWAAGYEGYSLDELYLSGQIGALIPAQDRPRRSAYLDLFRPWIIIAVVAMALLGRGLAQRRAVHAEIAALACWIAAVSLLPVMLAYPTISSLGGALATIPLAILASVLFVFSWPAGRQPARSLDDQ